MELADIVTISPKDTERISVLAEMAGKSFMEELWTLETLSALPVDYEGKLAISQDIMLNELLMASQYSGAYCTQDNAALAIGYLKSDLGGMKWGDIEDKAYEAVFANVDAEIRDAMISQIEHMEPISNFHWYEEFSDGGDFIHFAGLAVDSNKRGTGAFRRLVEPFLKYADIWGIPCFLETYSDKLEQLYEHFGFETVKVCKSPDFQIYERCMMRRPQ